MRLFSTIPPPLRSILISLVGEKTGYDHPTAHAVNPLPITGRVEEVFHYLYSQQ